MPKENHSLFPIIFVIPIVSFDCYKFCNVTPLLLRFGSIQFWSLGGKGSLTGLMSEETVCRTAPSSPGLVKGQGKYNKKLVMTHKRQKKKRNTLCLIADTGRLLLTLWNPWLLSAAAPPAPCCQGSFLGRPTQVGTGKYRVKIILFVSIYKLTASEVINITAFSCSSR